ncbi:MAG: hypothetical protein DMG34_01355, partial [Acidobacteria bacterium]
MPHYPFSATIFLLPMRPLGTSIRRALLPFVCVVPLFVASTSVAQEESVAVPLPVYEFHSGFWLNLHHTLYRIARSPRSSNSTANPGAVNAGIANLSPAEQRAWSAAIAFYSKTYADKDLTVSLEMIL